MHQIDKIVDEFVAPTFAGVGLDGCLGEAIEKDNHQRQDEPAQTRWIDHAVEEMALPSISVSAAEQRSQMVG